MALEKNMWLEKYEIKKPDYDLINRTPIDIDSISYEPARYFHNGTMWQSRIMHDNRKKIRVMFVGDITCFGGQLDEATREGGYDFSYEFEHIRPIFALADLVVGNLETMIFPNAPYRSEKLVSEQNYHCNAPIEFLDAVRKAGIDVVTNANNHDLDTGTIGIGATIDYIEHYGLIQTGTFKEEKKRYELLNVDGFKIAIIAFATEHNNKRCNLTAEGIDYLLNDYSEERAQSLIAEARNDGAEMVFVCIHWGKENVTSYNATQKKIAQELAEAGCDCIIGSHPHVLQPYGKIRVGEKNVPVFYSMGNFVSHNSNNLKARSIVACVDIVRADQKLELSCSYIPIFTSNNYGSKKFVVLPIPNDPSDSRNINRKELIQDVVGKQLQSNKAISFSELVEKKEAAKKQKQRAKVPKYDEIKKFPVTYDDGTFVYSIFEKHVQIDKLSSKNAAISCSVPNNILDLPVTCIKEAVFSNNHTIHKVNFRKNLPYISERLFKNCTTLEGFQLSDSMTEIKEEAFANCENLTAAVMRKGIQQIGERAFYNCPNLRTVKIPSNVVKIAADAFAACEKAVFYCEAGSYGEQYAKECGFPVVVMTLDD